jgi:lipoate---protein ligase
MMPEISTKPIAIRPYDLPDEQLMQVSEERGRCLVFAPPETVVVIGKGSDPARELVGERIEADHVPVLRRASGGCSVVLSPEMIVASFALYGENQRRSPEYFRLFNGLIMEALNQLGVDGLEHSGTSDIALKGRKIAGTAIYRNRQLVFHHAIINSGGDTGLMERYLRIPPRLPEYRRGRSHREFVTSLKAEGHSVSVEEFTIEIERNFKSIVR